MTFDDAWLVEMVIVEDAYTVDCNTALIHKDHALLSKCSLKKHLDWALRFTFLLLFLATGCLSFGGV